MKRAVLFFTVLCFCLTVAWADQPAKTINKEQIELTVPRISFASMAGEKGGSLKLIASDFKSPESDILLVPTDVTAVSLLETPVLVSVLIPSDKQRTHLLMAAGATHAWTQIPSTSPYRMGGSFSFFLTSSALPPPGQMRFRVSLDSQSETQPSAVEISRLRDPTETFGLDEKLMTFLVKGNFPALTEEQALQHARSLLQSDIQIEMKMQVRIRSVEEFDVGNAFLQVWGD
jgi:hypothetical protein